MVFVRTFFFLFLIILCTISCKSGSQNNEKITQLEQALSGKYTPETAKDLSNLYKEAVKSAPDDHENNFQYLTKAAELQFLKLDDAVSACRGIDDALGHHSKNQDLTKIMGLYAKIYAAYLYKSAPATRLDPDDIDKMRSHLSKNLPWLDSSLVKLDKEMIGTNLQITDKDKARDFIEIAEAYADLVKVSNPDKSVDLSLKAAGVAKSIENFNKATQLYYSVVTQHPEHPKAPTALFMMGFIYENDLLNIAKAKESYQEFLSKYPNDKDYGDDAEMALKNLGKSPEDLIKEFEKGGK